MKELMTNQQKCPDWGVAVGQPNVREEDHTMKQVPTLYTLFSTYLNSGPVPEGYGWTASYWSVEARRPKYHDHALPAAIRQGFAATIEEEITTMPSPISGICYLGLDVSGSMGYPIENKSLVRCIDVASLTYTVICRNNQNARVLPFSTKVHDTALDPKRTVTETTAQLISLYGTGTNPEEVLRVLNALGAEGTTVVVVSDYDAKAGQEWDRFKKRNPKARMVCLNLAPRPIERQPVGGVLYLDGFSDATFDKMTEFVGS